jgi:outer membrane protein TolC
MSATITVLLIVCRKSRLEEAAPAVNEPAAPRSFPALQHLEFALDRKYADPHEDEQCGGAPLVVNGVSLSKPQELPIDLPTVMRLAGCDNLDVRIACARLDEAHARVLAAKFQYLPTLQPFFDHRWHGGISQANQGQFQPAHKQATQLGLNLVGEWHVGETLFQVLAAKKRAVAQEAGVLTASELARLQAVNAYFNLVQAQTDVAIAEDRLKQGGETLKLTQNLVNGGAALLSEVKRAQAILAEVKQRVSAAKDRQRSVSLALTDALHIDPLVSLVPVQDSQTTLALVAPTRELPELVGDGISRRPELRDSRALWRALDTERRAAFLAPLVPTVSALVSKGAQDEHFANMRRSDDYSIGMGWKIGPGGIGDISRRRISEAQLKEEGLRFVQLGDRVAREIVENYTHMQSVLEQLGLTKEEIAAAAEALRLSQERLKNGVALTLEVTTAEDLLFDAKSRAANDIAEYNKAQYALLRSIGGFPVAECNEAEHDAYTTAPTPTSPAPPSNPPVSKDHP